MIDVQRMIKDMKKLAGEVNTVVTEMEEAILGVSINNQMTNATNIFGISEDLRFLVQSDIEEQAFQVQRMLADDLDRYKGRGNSNVDKNIWEIQNLYSNKKQQEKGKGKVEDEEVILVKPYEILQSKSSSSSSTTSFIMDEVGNLLKYMKFVQSPTQTRLFKLPPHYQSLKSRGKQDPEFWKEIAMALVDQKHNIKTARNGYPIVMFQGGPPHEPYFIAIDNRGQIITGPSKKTMAIYVVGELEVLV